MPPKQQQQMPFKMDTHYLNNIPDWAKEEYKTSMITIANLNEKIINLEHAISVLNNHKNSTTAPKSLHVKISVPVNDAHQEKMDQVLYGATKQFQATVLDGLIAAREAELKDRKTDLAKTSESIKKFITDGMDELHKNKITRLEEDEIRENHQLIQCSIDDQRELIEEQVRTTQFFKIKKKISEQDKRKAAAEERRLNQTLEDPNIGSLKQRVQELETAVRKVNEKKENIDNNGNNKGSSRPTPNNKQNSSRQAKQNKKTHNNNKADTNNKKRTDTHNNNSNNNNKTAPKGQGRGRGGGNRARRQSYTPSTSRSASRKRNSRQKRN